MFDPNQFWEYFIKGGTFLGACAGYEWGYKKIKPHAMKFFQWIRNKLHR